MTDTVNEIITQEIALGHSDVLALYEERTDLKKSVRKGPEENKGELVRNSVKGDKNRLKKQENIKLV